MLLCCTQNILPMHASKYRLLSSLRNAIPAQKLIALLEVLNVYVDIMSTSNLLTEQANL